MRKYGIRYMIFPLNLKMLVRQFLAEQLTLSQPGGQIMPTTVLQAPRIFRHCDDPVKYHGMLKL